MNALPDMQMRKRRSRAPLRANAEKGQVLMNEQTGLRNTIWPQRHTSAAVFYEFPHTLGHQLWFYILCVHICDRDSQNMCIY